MSSAINLPFTALYAKFVRRKFQFSAAYDVAVVSLFSTQTDNGNSFNRKLRYQFENLELHLTAKLMTDGIDLSLSLSSSFSPHLAGDILFL